MMRDPLSVKGLLSNVPAYNVSTPISDGGFKRYDFSFTDIHRITKNGYGDGRGGNALIAGIIAFWQRTFPQALLKASDKDSKKAVSQIEQILQNPNPEQSEAEFKNNIITNLLVGGECFVLFGKNKSGSPVQLWCYHGGLMQPRYNEQGYLSHYEYFNQSKAGSRKRYEIEDVIHLRWPAMSATNPKKAISPIVQCFREIETDNERGRAVYTFLKNDCNPLTVVRLTPGGSNPLLSPDQIKLWADQFTEATSGESRGKPMLAQGVEGVERLSTGFESLDTEAICKEIESRMGTIFGVSPILLDWCIGTKSSTYENVRHADERFNTRTFAPFLDYIADSITRGFKRYFTGNFEVWFDRSNMEAFKELQSKEEDRQIKLLNNKIKTVSEVRESLNLPPMEEQKAQNELRTTVGGAQTLDAKQEKYLTSGGKHRKLYVNTAIITFGYTKEEAEELFPILSTEEIGQTTVDPEGNLTTNPEPIEA